MTRECRAPIPRLAAPRGHGPRDLSIGIVTGLVGGVFFIWMVSRGRA
ncbi:hypothetical protein [uncultured Paracoccus sp.]|nr:hypothetical protein [uncultured Paracoccus sp.]